MVFCRPLSKIVDIQLGRYKISLLHGITHGSNYYNWAKLFVDVQYFKGEDKVEEVRVIEMEDFPYGAVYERMKEGFN